MKLRHFYRATYISLACFIVGFSAIISYKFYKEKNIDFNLPGPDGKTYSRNSFSNEKTLVIYFGYSNCWKFCSTTMSSIARALDELGDKANHIQPIFISLDPKRESIDKINTYLQGFGENFIGLAGSETDVLQTAEKFDIPVERVQYSEDPNDYVMRHDSPILIWRPDQKRPMAVSDAVDIEKLKSLLAPNSAAG